MCRQEEVLRKSDIQLGFKSLTSKYLLNALNTGPMAEVPLSMHCHHWCSYTQHTQACAQVKFMQKAKAKKSTA